VKFLLDTVESLKIAFTAIIANKARGVLTTLGIIIGIVAVTTTMTAFNGIKSSFMQGAGAIGVDVVYVSRMPWIMMGDWFQYRNRPRLTIIEAEALEDALLGRNHRKDVVHDKSGSGFGPVPDGVR
jgi:putative ABC transport system permease protein